MTDYSSSQYLSSSTSVPRRFNLDCHGLTPEEYKFLLDDIDEAIAEGNRKYGYGEPGYIGADGYFYPLPEGVILPVPESKPKSKAKSRARFRAKAKSRMMRKIDSLLRPQIGGIRR